MLRPDLQRLHVTILKSSNVLMGFLFAFVFLWQALFLHEKQIFLQVDHSKAGINMCTVGSRPASVGPVHRPVQPPAKPAAKPATKAAKPGTKASKCAAKLLPWWQPSLQPNLQLESPFLWPLLSMCSSLR